MQDILSRFKQDLEVTLFIGLDLNDLATIGVVHCQSGLIRLIRTFLPLLHDRAHWTDKDLSLNAAIGGCGGTACGQKQNQQRKDAYNIFHGNQKMG